MSLNKKYVCSICEKILNLAVKLPCNCQSICKEHVDNLLKFHDKEATIECSVCKNSYDNACRIFKLDASINDEIEKDLHLTKEEKEIKKQLKDVLEAIKIQKDDIGLKINEFSLKQADYFENIRREIDITRETIIQKAYALFPEEKSLKIVKKIQKQSVDLIDLVENGENDFRNKFNKSIVPSLINIDMLVETKRINEIFRNNVLNLSEIENLKSEYKVSLEMMHKKCKFFKLFEHDLKSNKFIARLNSLGEVELNLDFKKTFHYLNISGQKQLFQIKS